MMFRRCPTCRTLCDAERDPRCFACGAPLPAAVHSPEQARQVQRETRGDLSAGKFLLALLGGLAVLGWFLSPKSLPILFLSLLPLAAVVALLLASPDSRFNAAGKVVLTVFAGIGVVALVAIAVGVALLVHFLVACANGKN